MDGSSESGWPRSDNSTGLNSSSLLDRNPRAARARSSGDNTSRDSGGFLSSRKGRDKTLWPQVSHLRAPFGDCGVGVGGGGGGSVGVAAECKDVSLRQWLDTPGRKVDALECLHIFSQIADIVNRAHSQGIVVHNVRPSCFTISSFNRVTFAESPSNYSDCASDSLDCGSNPQMAEFKDSSPPPAMHFSGNLRRHNSTLKQILLVEPNWYRSPEEAAGAPTSCASDIYQLGVLLFELFYAFDSLEEKSTTMASLRHRVLPPQMLLTWPKQTSFCLWLLHPEPSCRPKMSELLHSEFLNEPRDDIEEREAALELREKIEEQELLLEFLLLLQQRKQDATDSLNETISFISSDIEEATNMQTALRAKADPNLDPSQNSTAGPLSVNMTDDDDSGFSGSRKRVRQGLCIGNSRESNNHPDDHHKSERHQASALPKSSRLMKNFRKFESAYFLTRRRFVKPAGGLLARPSPLSSGGRGSIVATERSSISNQSLKERPNELGQRGWVNTFLEGLSKYLSYSSLKVKANLKQGDLLNSSNLVCSLSFDRDGEFFATAGVNKKIKVFDYNSILSEDRDIHYPVVEMSGRSKLSSTCWNGYIKGQIASSNFDGVVQVWDVSRRQTFIEMKEHERRVWSVDFSVADPTLLASGSDDGSVKLWNINQAILFSHLVGQVSVPSGRRPMSAVFSSQLTLAVLLHSARRIIKYITMIFATRRCLSVLSSGTIKP
ncbi:protein SPA1-RELATED 3-like isoform X2 [Andrographis paniculata]|uniref:protein SPA1-RELATED 3-like isoform X2 n=1 Tax=Andrographis paniculata TaxID=175694 RepID=UPI0021E8F83C|nr:protein SPA1-RELATED 3-like isoform X2 [Andrographis paniculata]